MNFGWIGANEFFSGESEQQQDWGRPVRCGDDDRCGNWPDPSSPVPRLRMGTGHLRANIRPRPGGRFDGAKIVTHYVGKTQGNSGAPPHCICLAKAANG